MSRYVLLMIMTSPFIFAGVLSALTQYKMGRISQRKFLTQTTLWVCILVALIFSEQLYYTLYNRGYTQTDSLSLFDVIQITGIIVLFYIANRLIAKVERLEVRLKDLHQELSIRLSDRQEK